MSSHEPSSPIVVRGTEILPNDPVRSLRQKIARITLDAMVQFVGLLDAKGTVLEINKVALDAVGITLADVQGKPFWTTFWWQVSEEINATLRASIARAAQGEFVRWDTPIYGRAGGKETIIIDASLMPVLDDNGKVVFICAEGRDITEKKAQEREIAQKNVELQGLLERIRELDEIKTQFFANVSHELRTPLALILGPAQRLLDDDGALPLAARHESADVVLRNARMLLKHVNDLLDISRLEAKKLKIELIDTDLAAQVRFLASHFAVLAADRKIDYAVLADEPCVAAVDTDKLQRVLMNLLGNAFKFVPAGGRVRCSLQPSPSQVVIVVEDSGPGVKPELRQAIFERFRQGDGGSNRKLGGTGLGLAIAKEFIELHKGRIEVLDSELGGARFQVTFPLHRLAKDDALAAPALHAGTMSFAAMPSIAMPLAVDRGVLDGLLEELRANRAATDAPSTNAILENESGVPLSGATSKPLVLVVEDNPDMNRFVCQCLAGRYEVISAFDGGEGLRKALEFRPALVVSDIMMPAVSGDELVAEIRKHPDLAHTPILLLSAKADEALMVKLLDAGAQDYVVKPFSEKELTVRVQNLVAAERARQQTSAALVREQQARAELDGLRQAAEGANRAKDEFLAMLGHELRNPLSPIVTALQLMKQGRPELSARARTVIERQVSHLVRLVDDLLDVSRIARGKVELRLETVELADVVAKGIEMVSPLFDERGHTLTVDLASESLPVHGDATRLSQVVSNLLTNAARYTPPSGHVVIRGARTGDAVELSVRDNGVGISAEALPHIFDLFVQGRQASDRAHGGLGLGLTIVRSLVERHGGSVSVRSDGPGRGSEFTVRLPEATPGSATNGITPSATTPQAAHEHVPGPRVLVVDDNEDSAEMLSIALGSRGYATRAAHDAPSALQAAAEFMPDVAIVDIGLPVIDGYELAAQLLALPGLERLHLIALTGYGQDSDRRRSRQAGFHLHLVKPVGMAALEQAIGARSGEQPGPAGRV